MILRTFGTMARVVATALILGSGLVAAAPAEADPGFHLGFGFGDDDDDAGSLFRHRTPEFMICLTDLQIRNAISDRGYHDIYLNAPNDEYIQVRATKGDWVYLIEFNFCANDIVDRQRLRRS